MDSRIIVILVIGILAGGGVGYGAAHLVYTPQIKGLKTELSDLESQYDTLTEEHEALSGEYEALETERDTLQSQFSTLSSEYTALQSQYGLLSNDYEKVSDYLKDLSSDVKSFIDLLNNYCKIPEAFHHVLNAEELEKIASDVVYVTKESEDNWYAYGRICKHVIYRIDYATDLEYPYIGNYYHEMIDGNEIITDFSLDTIMNYIQTPEITLEYKQGDCADQTILVYAMIKYYERNIYGEEYTSYIAEMELSDNSSHLAVFLPVEGGRQRENRLCILDPAGEYFTNTHEQITQRVVSPELEIYSEIWLKTAVEIVNIKLYDVDVSDGSYTVAASGTLDQIAEFLEAK